MTIPITGLKLNSTQIRQDVQAAKDAGADVIVALVHWGSEYGRSISEPQQEAADLLMKNGVDVIIGTHSHLVGEYGLTRRSHRPTEVRKTALSPTAWVISTPIPPTRRHRAP